MNLAFASPYFLILLLLLPCFLWCREHIEVFYFPKLNWVGKESPFFSIDPWIKMLLYTLMVVSLSEPYIYDPSSSSHKRGRDLVLAIDASGSMAESGFDTKDRFKNKYEITTKLSQEFIKHRADDNMGLVVFGTFAYSASPLTYDLSALSYLLDMTTVGVAGESTAIGDAIVQSLVTLSYGNAKNRVIILLTDGYHNAGKTSPKDAVKMAKDEKVKIYTIGIGKKSEYDVALLETIAKESGGLSYSASSAEQLQKVYKEIESLEPSPIRSENFLDRYMLFYYPLGLAFVLLLFWVIWQRRSR
ncbi:BatA (Bacteroides aerotolerance operon) [hydrothermal vent metagenome]|uniref:BatA (Bacteroides aerotolerance operon) n=1 Tax=hydrothermal vent metagenome TaxID=652676 RepID=A0A1W1BAJ8_9ZZZZ